MTRYLAGFATLVALTLFATSAQAQWVQSYYAPAYMAPVPVRAYYAPVAPAYYAAPTTAYYAPVRTAAYYAPTTAYYGAAPAYFAPPVTSYYAPAVAPVVVGRPVVPFYSGYGGAEIRVPGRPVANTLRTIIP